MTTSIKERLALLKEFGSDVTRIQQCLLVNRHTVTPLQAVRMWLDYSDSLCAAWLQLPVEDKELVGILLKHLPNTKMMSASPPTWQAKLVDAGDGSGDAILELPDELLMQLEWSEEDILEVSVKDSSISVIRKA